MSDRVNTRQRLRPWPADRWPAVWRCYWCGQAAVAISGGRRSSLCNACVARALGVDPISPGSWPTPR
jgi:hypothetical protein